MIKLVLCSTLNGGIGKDNELLYNISEDMKFFRSITQGHDVLMGINTWDSLPTKPLPNRKNIVASLNKKDLERINRSNPSVKTIDNLFSYAVQESIDTVDDTFVIGGAAIYNWFIDMRMIDEAYVTLVPIVREDADAVIKIEKLFKYLPHRDVIKEFVYDGMKIKILHLQKHRKE